MIAIIKKMHNLLAKKKRVAGFILALIFVIGMHWLALSVKVLDIELEIYSERGVDLKVTPQYRYGYFRTWHGAILVKTANVAGASPKDFNGEHPYDLFSDEPYPDEDPAINEYAPGLTPEQQRAILLNSPVDVIMRNELKNVQMKFNLELSLYVWMLLYVFFGVRFISQQFQIEQRRNIWQCLFTAAAWIIFWLIAFLPLGLFDYGHPIHSTWEGPGALSYSYFPPRISPGSGLTISYRYVIDILSSYPIMFFAVISSGFQHMTDISYKIQLSIMVMGSIFFGLLGLVYINKRKERSSGGSRFAYFK